MDRIYFTEEEMNTLRQNKYVQNVTKKSISFTKEFKEHFIKESNEGKGPRRILIECGLNPYVLGKRRIDGFSSRIKKKNKNNESFDDNRGKKSTGRPKRQLEKILSPEEELVELKHEMAMLKAENDLLKKMKFLIEEKESKKSLHNKDFK